MTDNGRGRRILNEQYFRDHLYKLNYPIDVFSKHLLNIRGDYELGTSLRAETMNMTMSKTCLSSRS